VPPPATTWEYEEGGRWHTFGEDAAVQVEEALQSLPPHHNPQSSFVNPRTKVMTTYTYDLKRCVQINMVSQYERRIRRLPSYHLSIFDEDEEEEEDADEEEEEDADEEEDDEDEDEEGEAEAAVGNRACSICCCEDKITLEDACQLPTDTCRHGTRTVCDECLARHIHAEVTGKGNVSTITCPESGCAAVMKHHEVQRWAIAQVFETYDTLLLRSHLQALEDFRWCAWAGCGYGQIHPSMDDAPIMKCQKCKRKTCFTHSCEWHQDRTCAEFEDDAAQSEEVALLQQLENGGKIKRCPKCSQGIEKNQGCDHMTCRKPVGCGYEFCWRCLAPYDGVAGIRSVGNTAHHTSCVYYM